MLAPLKQVAPGGVGGGGARLSPLTLGSILCVCEQQVFLVPP